MTRNHTAVDQLVEDYLDEYVALDPSFATFVGISGHDAELPDLSPDGHAARSALRLRTLAALAEATPADATDRITVAAATERLSVAEEVYQLGADESDLNIIASPVQSVRAVFDLMATATADDWSTIATRLGRIPAAIDGYIVSLRAAASRGDVSPRRQVEACIGQCDDNIGSDGFFATLVAGAGDVPASLRADLDRGAAAAADAYARLRAFLAAELLPVAPTGDAVGSERYAVFSRSFLGSAIDLEETYIWGQKELARIADLMQQTASRILPGASVPEAIAYLATDPSRKLAGTDALQAWMQQKSDAAIAALADTHFDIPEPIHTLECRIAPTHTGGIYYTGPSEDFSRPGRMWWSVPKGVTEFTTWKELSVVYHEGVPGHHLQIAQTTYRRELLNRWRRMAAWISGHGEGWALYAEWLMADLGFLDDPADFLGMLDSQSLRAARVVLDIGIHCGFDAPAEVGGGAWDYDKAWRFLTAHSSKSEPQLRYELDRYLGWPGQAPAYKIGERLWLSLRDEVRRRDGDAFDLKTFHRQALDIGSVGLDVLRAAVLGSFGQ
ncbi:MAG TPA: DUF885 domain-containing protein [Jatrophihabitantaceae bacterium]|nr:DUF885 domain-containing protein [Jatrophihabitantaceae bacterium]